jgi:hypothetical protein
MLLSTSIQNQMPWISENKFDILQDMIKNRKLQ